MRWSYRPELDGLRAIAVIAVILYHAGGVVPGGFVGVDVFFTLSGYLVTSVILDQMQRGEFSAKDFWIRRARRLLPAALVVSFSTIATGIIAFWPRDLAALAKSNIAQMGFLANVQFWRESGYFAEAAHTKPLLHYWSLAVEEQFYFIFPVLTLATVRLSGMRGLRWVIVIFASLSLGACIYAAKHHSSANFYLLPTRAWELLVGALLASSAEPGWQVPSRAKDGLGWLGVAAVIGSFFAIDESVSFPGPAATPVIFGTAVMIWATRGRPKSLLPRLLSHATATAVGKWSYSLYLWHWPFLAFLQYLHPDAGGWTRCVAIISACAAAVFCYHFLEEPIRRRRILASNTALLVTLGFFATAQLAFSTICWKSGGLPKRFDAGTLATLEDIAWTPAEASIIEDMVHPIRIGTSSEEVRFNVIGDSHAAIMQKVLHEIALRRNVAGKGYAMSLGPPGLGIWRPARESEQEGVARRQLIASSLDKGATIVIASQWHNPCNSPAPRDIIKYVHDAHNHADTPASSAHALESGMVRLVAHLIESGSRVVVVRQVPETPWADSARRWMRRNDEAFIDYWEHNQEQRQNVDAIMNRLAKMGCHIVDPMPYFRDGEGRIRIAANGYSLYRDNNHLSKSGAAWIADQMEAELVEALGWD